MKLYERITADNFKKGTKLDGVKGTCLLGHAMILYGYPQTRHVVIPRLIEAISTLFPDRGDPNLVYPFNDHEDTTLEDVIRVCKLADV